MNITKSKIRRYLARIVIVDNKSCFQDNGLIIGMKFYVR